MLQGYAVSCWSDFCAFVRKRPCVLLLSVPGEGFAARNLNLGVRALFDSYSLNLKYFPAEEVCDERGGMFVPFD